MDAVQNAKLRVDKISLVVRRWINVVSNAILRVALGIVNGRRRKVVCHIMIIAHSDATAKATQNHVTLTNSHLHQFHMKVLTFLATLVPNAHGHVLSNRLVSSSAHLRNALSHLSRSIRKISKQPIITFPTTLATRRATILWVQIRCVALRVAFFAPMYFLRFISAGATKSLHWCKVTSL